MEKRDARSISPEAQEEVRRQAVKLHCEGLKNTEIAQILDVHRSTVSGWLTHYNLEGTSSLRAKKRGRPPGSGMQLDEKQQDMIKRLLIDKSPDQLKLPFALWSREAVGLLIEERTSKKLDVRQVGRYLKRWGFTPQRPIKRAYQRCDKKVAQWLEHDYPAIKAQAEKEGAEIHWTDEAGLKSHDHRGRGYAPKGKTPVRMHNPNYEKINKISSVTNQGKLRFLCYTGSFTYKVFHRYLRGLIIEAGGRKLHVIVDNLRVHHAKVIKRWVRRYSTLIELHYLPSYSPDLNPDEYLNCDLKTELAKRPERRQKGKWPEVVQATLNDLASQPDRIKSYFKAQSIQYAM